MCLEYEKINIIRRCAYDDDDDGGNDDDDVVVVGIN